MSGKNIYAIYGNSQKEMTIKILTKMQPVRNLDKKASIALKPNLVLAKPSESGATTSPDIVEGVIEYLQSNGYYNITIMESSWIGDSTEKAYQACGYTKIADEYSIPLIDLKTDKVVINKVKELSFEVYQRILDIDYLINIPVLKAHCQTNLTCALKNLKGCIPDKEKKRFHSLGLHKPIAALNKVVKTDLIVVDGIIGDLTYEEGGNPVEMGRILAGYDPVLIDSYAAGLLGYSVSEIPYLRYATEMGVGSLYDENENIIIEIDRDKMPSNSIKATRLVEELAKYVEEKEACSPCYGSLIHALHRLKDKGQLKFLKEKIFIGRGYQNLKETGLGIGICTSEFTKSIQGCPPNASKIIEFLQKNSE